MVADGKLLLPPQKAASPPVAVATVSITTPSTSSSPTVSSSTNGSTSLSPPTFQRLREDIIGGFGWNFAASDNGYYHSIDCYNTLDTLIMLWF
jgi:hypothetical protein